jgi:hypothetical protein
LHAVAVARQEKLRHLQEAQAEDDRESYLLRQQLLEVMPDGLAFHTEVNSPTRHYSKTTVGIVVENRQIVCHVLQSIYDLPDAVVSEEPLMVEASQGELTEPS